MSLSPRLSLALTLAGAVLLSGCGKLGDLERPAPLFGAKEKAQYESDKREAAAKAHQQSQAGSVGEVADPATSTASQRQAPIFGTVPDPSGGPSGPGFPNSGPN
jgi:hypothetical protein